MASSVTVTRVAGTLSTTAQPPSKPLVVGPASAGTPNTVLTFAEVGAVNTGIGYGPAALASQIMLNEGGGSCDVIVANASIAGTTSAIVTGSGPVITVSGTPNDSFAFQGSILNGGTVGTATFQYSLDGGQTIAGQSNGQLFASGSFPIVNTGLTLSFSVGTYPAAQGFNFSAFAPQCSGADITTALNAFSGSLSVPTVILIANDTQSAVSGSAVFTSVDAALTMLSQPNIDIPTMAVVPTGGVDGQPTAVLAAFSSVAASTGNVIEAVAERARIAVPVPFAGFGNPKRPLAWAVAARINSDLVSTNPARLVSGPLTGWSSPTYDEAVNGSVYEPALIGAPRTWKGYPGVYLNQGVLKSAAGSAYDQVQNGRVILLAAITLLLAEKRYINTAAKCKLDGTGQFTTKFADKVDADVNAQLQAAIMDPLDAEGDPGYASGVLFTVNRTDNVLSTKTMRGICVLVPNANINGVAIQLSFSAKLNNVTT